jgi:hypothetical protein
MLLQATDNKNFQDIISAVSFGGSFNTLIEKPGEKPHPIIHWINDIAFLCFTVRTVQSIIRNN